MRVLYLTMNPNRQSTTVPTEGWFRLLRPKGLEPVLISSQTGAFQQWAAEQGIPCYHVPLPFPNLRWPFPFLRSLVRVVRIARAQRIQLVHCNEHDIYPIGQYVARLLRVPVVLSIHFTLRDGFSKWAFGGARCPDRAFFLSQGSLEACRPDVQGVIPEDRWHVLYNGLDMNAFRPDRTLRESFRREHGLADQIAIGAACALRPRKQLEHLFRAAAQVQNPALRVIVAGAPVSGDEKYGTDLLAMGRELLGDRFKPLGHLSELRPFYNGLDLFVNTSQEEACSISVIEALACGLPIVGYPSTSVDEQVLPSGGEIVAQDDVNALTAAIERWLRRPDLSTAARADARDRAHVFDIATLADDLWRVYGELVPG
jgi:glycosyltransferase involved in cell wall biosynthesis